MLIQWGDAAASDIGEAKVKTFVDKVGAGERGAQLMLAGRWWGGVGHCGGNVGVGHCGGTVGVGHYGGTVTVGHCGVGWANVLTQQACCGGGVGMIAKLGQDNEH